MVGSKVLSEVLDIVSVADEGETEGPTDSFQSMGTPVQ